MLPCPPLRFSKVSGMVSVVISGISGGASLVVTKITKVCLGPLGPSLFPRVLLRVLLRRLFGLMGTRVVGPRGLGLGRFFLP